MAHDVYSIDVVLFEIGLWRCFLIWDNRLRDCNIDEEVLPGGQSILQSMREVRPGAGKQLKALYEMLARQDLLNFMGDIFTEIVLSRLSAVESGLAGETGTEGGTERAERDESPGEEAERVGLAYIETVLDAFEKISI
jgi:hypothetical protein